MDPDEPGEELRREIGEMPLDADVAVAPRPYPHPWTLVRAHLDLLPVISAGGALGSLARWGLAEAFPHPTSAFAWGTFLANLTGALALGVLMALMLDVWASRRYIRPFLGVGVIGGYTTFSTWMLDTRGLLASGRFPLAAAYVLGTLLAGLVAVGLGLTLTRAAIDRLRPSPPSETETETA